MAGQPDAIATDVVCIQCGYNLRGLRADAHCPECGAPVEHSLQGDLLRHSSPEWLHSLSRGLRLAKWGFGGLACAGLILAASRLLPGRAARICAAIAGCVSLAAALGVFVGLMLLTRPEPREAAGQGRAPLRLATRLLALAVAALVTCGGILTALGLFTMGRNRHTLVGGVVLATLLVALGVVFCRLVGRILKRAPEEGASGVEEDAQGALFLSVITAVVGEVALLLEIAVGFGGMLSGCALFALPVMLEINLLLLYGVAASTDRVVRRVLTRAVRGTDEVRSEPRP